MNSSSEASNRKSAAPGPTFHEIHGSTYLERDEQKLARLGKSQVLKVLFESLGLRAPGFNTGCRVKNYWQVHNRLANT